MNKITANHFYPERLSIKTGEISSKEIDIVSNLQLNINDNFIQVGDLRFEPPTTTISGNIKLLDSISQ